MGHEYIDTLKIPHYSLIFKKISLEQSNINKRLSYFQAHQSVCKRLPLKCPNKCGAIVPREEVSV